MSGLPYFNATRCTSLIIAAFATAAHSASPLPQNGAFVAGSCVITQSASAVNITQNTTRGVIDWRSSSIGPGNRVDVNSGSGATLSRVTGAGASSLDGALKATGSFYFTNPQGVVVGPSGIATKGGFFVASTLDVDDSAFMAGNGNLQLTGTSEAAVVDLVAIGSSGGDVMLISRAITLNASSIDASKGTIELVNGNAALIQDSTTTRQVYVQAGAQGDVVDAGSMPVPPDDVRGVTTVADKRNVPGPASATDTASGLVADDVPRSRSPGDAPSRSTGRQSRASCHHFGFNDVPDASTAHRSNAEEFDHGESGSGIHWFLHCRLGGRTSVRDPFAAARGVTRVMSRFEWTAVSRQQSLPVGISPFVHADLLPKALKVPDDVALRAAMNVVSRRALSDARKLVCMDRYRSEPWRSLRKTGARLSGRRRSGLT